MKKSLVFLCFVVLVFGLMGSVNAMTYTDTYDAQHQYMNKPNKVSWTFDLTKYGFDPKTQNLTSVSMLLNFADDFDSSKEKALLRVKGVGGGVFKWKVNTGVKKFDIGPLLSLSKKGVLKLTLKAGLGDFYFNSATLTANGINTIPTPEPATVILLGMGLAGLIGVGAARRKKMKKSVR